MPSTNEVISLVDAADTAVWTAGVLDLLEDSHRVPRYAREVVDRAIAMLDDALKGSALLTGLGDSQGFSGNLDALCWATDSYIAERADELPPPDPAKVQESLKQIQEQMTHIRDRIKTEIPTQCHGVPFEEAKRFFDTLAKVLARRATASLTRPSGVYSATGIS